MTYKVRPFSHTAAKNKAITTPCLVSANFHGGELWSEKSCNRPIKIALLHVRTRTDHGLPNASLRRRDVV